MKNRLLILIMCMLLLSMILYHGYQIISSSSEEEVYLQQMKEQENQIIEETYNRPGIVAKYPRFIAGGSKDEIDQWNQLIKTDFDKILHIYSFQPIPGPIPTPSGIIPASLQIIYDIKLNNNDLISIFYRATFLSPYAAHPTELVYTTNIDKVNNKRILLKDKVILNQAFVQNFRSWDMVGAEKENEEVKKAIKDYLKDMNDDDLLKGLKAADLIGSGNIYDIYSYYTTDKVGISLGVPNYLGDHIEFEQEYKKLKK